MSRCVSVLFGPDKQGGLGEPDLAELARIATDAGVVASTRTHQRLLERVGAEAAHLFRPSPSVAVPATSTSRWNPALRRIRRNTPSGPRARPGDPCALVVCPGYQAADRRLLETFVYTEAEG